MLYPLKFQPVYKNVLWGGRNIERRFKRQIPQGSIGESWELCCRDNGMSIVSNGYLKGKSINEVIAVFKDKLLGTKIYNKPYDTFPLLIKLIDANDKLSVQVHPDDEYAKANNEINGKNEVWYIIDAKPDAKLIFGLKEGTTKDNFAGAVERGNVKYFLNEVHVKPGDVFYIPAGTVHAILDGILIAEIQQNSDTTYRVYDWDRLDINGNPRELHIKRALDVINFEQKYINNSFNNTYDCGTYSLKELTSNKYFTVDEINIDDKYYCSGDNSTFYIYMIIDGEGIIKFSGGQETVGPGDTVLIPSYPGNHEIHGRIKALKVYI